jgi:hypothetical protein
MGDTRNGDVLDSCEEPGKKVGLKQNVNTCLCRLRREVLRNERESVLSRLYAS